MAASASDQVEADAAAAQGAARNAVQHLRLEASGDDYDAFMALPDDARRARYDELTRAARSTLHAPLKGVNAQKRERLKNMKVLILDNSQREPSVASVWGHTLADKLEIDNIVRGLGFKHVVAGVPTDAGTVDDLFCEQLSDTPYAPWTFSEFTDWNLVDGLPVFDDTHVPVGMRKTADYNLRHVILEVDTCASFWDCNFSISDFTEGVVFWTRWLREKAADATMIVNLRDLAKGMLRCPDRCVAMVVAMAELPRDVRPAALLFEEPFGEYLPCEVGGWTALLRETMDAHGWPRAVRKSNFTV